MYKVVLFIVDDTPVRTFVVGGLWGENSESVDVKIVNGESLDCIISFLLVDCCEIFCVNRSAEIDYSSPTTVTAVIIRSLTAIYCIISICQ